MGKPTKSITNECVGAMTRLNVLCFRLSHIYHVDRRNDRLAFARGFVGSIAGRHTVSYSSRKRTLNKERIQDPG